MKEPAVDDALKRLLAVEDAAGDLVRKAEQGSERLIEAALREANQQEERFEARIPELRASFIDKAAQRAEQTVSEMERRFEETLVQLRDAADLHEAAALDRAFAVLLRGGERGAG
jgi:V/A-type H+/Na+-transporting ATPase subunit G/H